MKLSDIAEFITDKISSSSISLDNYVTTDSLLQNKRGRELAQNLPPMQCALTNYKKGDVLVANIRPYLKKVWFADSEGGCSSDVLVFRAKNEHYPSFLYAILMQDAFFDYAMLGAKGSKMPRGDKNQIMRYELPTFTSAEEENIGNIMVDVISKINVNRQINDNLEAMAKQLYDYWFVQFDFPNEEGKPYKSSGGAMVWNEKLKREIPKEWMASNYTDLFTIGNGQTMPQNEGLVPAYGGNGIVKMVEISNYPACIIIGRVGANCGSIHYSKVPCWVSDNAVSICSKNDDWQPFLFYSLKLYNLSKNKGGSSQPLITHEALKHLYFPMSEKHINQFCHIVNELQDLIYSNQQEILKLTKQRDELLPLLMNGQATVNYHLSAC